MTYSRSLSQKMAEPDSNLILTAELVLLNHTYHYVDSPLSLTGVDWPLTKWIP